MEIMMSIIDLIFRILQGLLTPLIAIIAVYIAYQQHKTNRDKLRLDLYNKRYEVFYSLMKLLGHMRQAGKIEPEQVNMFLKESQEDVFLFGKDIVSYLETVRKKALDLWETNEELKDMPRGKERNKKVREATNLLHWLGEQFVVAIDKFGKYLKFEQGLKGKSLNLKRGFERIREILSVIVGLLCCIFPCKLFWDTFVVGDDTFHIKYIGHLFVICIFVFAVGYFISGIIFWIINLVVLYLIKGFSDDNPKDKKNNK